MDKVLNVWASNRDSDKVRAFKSALAYRKRESWVWIESPEKANLWVLDSFSVKDDMYYYHQRLRSRPLVAVINYNGKEELSDGWQNFTSPINVHNVIEWLDTSLSPPVSQEKEALVTNNVSEPWKVNRFKLAAWPNISKFKTNRNIPLICSHLLKKFYSFDDVLKWGIDDSMLDELLKVADKQNLLKFELTTSTVDSKVIGYGEGKDESQSLIQKLLARFS